MEDCLFWPSLKKDIWKVIKQCRACQVGKGSKQYIYIYILISKFKLYKNAKGAHQSTYGVYDGCLIAPKRIGKTKKYSLPQSIPNQSIKSTKDIEVCSINMFVQDNKLHKNKNFNL